jgi:FkbM family methyltransferase
MLRHHMAINNLSNVHIVAAAAGDAPGTADFYAETWNGMGRLGAPNSRLENTERFTVPITTVDEQVALTGLVPDFMLIDVEGFEITVLEGAKETLMRHRPTVVVEMHPSVWASARTDRNRAESLLRDLGLRAEPFLPGRDPLADHCLSFLRPL